MYGYAAAVLKKFGKYTFDSDFSYHVGSEMELIFRRFISDNSEAIYRQPYSARAIHNINLTFLCTLEMFYFIPECFAYGYTRMYNRGREGFVVNQTQGIALKNFTYALQYGLMSCIACTHAV